MGNAVKHFFHGELNIIDLSACFNLSNLENMKMSSAGSGHLPTYLSTNLSFNSTEIKSSKLRAGPNLRGSLGPVQL